MKNIYYKDDNCTLIRGDSFKVLRKIEDRSVNFIFADPPYFLSGNGITCSGGKMVSVNKGEWDKKISVKEKLDFNNKWIKECYRILKDNGTIAISGTFHNIYTIGVALELNNFEIINNITWKKTNPPPNISCKALTHSTETILWAKKKNCKYTFNYKVLKELNFNKQMKDVWEFSLTKQSEKKEGKHPTQKPLCLLERILVMATNKDDVVLDPFNGSGTTGVACTKLNRKYIGIEINEEYLEISKKRIIKESRDN